jgi:hypothetical protein
MIERWIVAGVIVATSLYALRGFWSEWRGKSLSDAHRAPEWWPVDLLWWRALVRSGPAGTIEGPLVAAGYVVSGLDSWSAQQPIQVVLAVLVAIALLLTAMVALRNRPKLLVAPHLRQFPGILDELRGAQVPQER